MRTFTSIAVMVFLLVAAISPVHAQSSHTAPLSALDAAVQEHVTSAAADRESVLQLLARPEIRAVAGDLGLDLRRAESAVATLDGSALSEVAAQARQVQQALAGGQSVTISTTLIIVALLVLILIIVAVN